MDYSFEHWVMNRFGSTMYKLYFKPYTEKVWGIDPSMLDPRTASETNCLQLRVRHYPPDALLLPL